MSLCLQEVPLWALPRLARWSGMSVRTWSRGARRRSWLGGAITRLHNGFFRSALAGQANAILLAPALEPLEHRPSGSTSAGASRGSCHAVRLDGLVVVATCTRRTTSADPEIPAAEIVRAEAFVTGLAGGAPVVLAGDFNLRAEHLPELAGWSALGPGIDHVLVRGPRALAAPRLAGERRRHDGAVLSDHAPVEVTVG